MGSGPIVKSHSEVWVQGVPPTSRWGTLPDRRVRWVKGSPTKVLREGFRSGRVSTSK